MDVGLYEREREPGVKIREGERRGVRKRVDAKL